MVREEVLIAKISSVRHHLRRIRDRLPGSEESFVTDEDARDIVVHNLWQAIRGCIDLAAHVVSDEGLGQPSQLGELFDLLAEAGVVPLELAARLRRAVGLRNIMAHEYVRLELPIVYRAARYERGDIEAFLLRLVDRFGPGEG